MGRTIYVGGIPAETSEVALHGLFQRFGAIDEVRVIRRRSTDGRIFAYVTFASPRAAEAACALDGAALDGLRLRVAVAR